MFVLQTHINYVCKIGTNIVFVLGMKKNIHVVPNGSQWAVKSSGNTRCTKITSTQSEAISVAREIAKNQHSELIIHGRNGVVREKNSYGNDPRKIKG